MNDLFLETHNDVMREEPSAKGLMKDTFNSDEREFQERSEEQDYSQMTIDRSGPVYPEAEARLLQFEQQTKNEQLLSSLEQLLHM